MAMYARIYCGSFRRDRNVTVTLANTTASHVHGKRTCQRTANIGAKLYGCRLLITVLLIGYERTIWTDSGLGQMFENTAG